MYTCTKSIMFTCIFLLPDTHGGAYERALLNKLLANYNTLERPVENESEPLQVKFGITLQQIIDVVSTIKLKHLFSFFLFITLFFRI
jgi:hypothetical protein